MSLLKWPRRKAATNQPTGEVQTRRNTAGEFYFVVIATNGEIVAVSEGYTRPQDAFRGSLALRRAMERPRWTEDLS